MTLDEMQQKDKWKVLSAKEMKELAAVMIKFWRVQKEKSEWTLVRELKLSFSQNVRRLLNYGGSSWKNDIATDGKRPQ